MYPRNRKPYFSFILSLDRFLRFLSIKNNVTNGTHKPHKISAGIETQKIYHKWSSSHHFIFYSSVSHHSSSSISVHENIDIVVMNIVGWIKNKTMIIVETKLLFRYSILFLQEDTIPQNAADSTITIMGSMLDNKIFV